MVSKFHRHKWILMVGEDYRYCANVECHEWQEFVRIIGYECWRRIPELSVLNGCANRLLLDKYFRERGVTESYMSLLKFLRSQYNG